MFDASGSELLSVPGDRIPLRFVAFSPGGDRVYSADSSSDIRIWGTGSAYFPGAAELVNSLREPLFRWSEVASRIRETPSLDPKLIQAALELCRQRGDNIGGWNRHTRAVVADPKRTMGEYRKLLDEAATALQAYPWSPDLLSTLGTAQYRNGRYRESLETLMRSESLRGYPYDADLILIAMNHYRLGEIEKAHKELAAAVPVRSRMAGAQRAFLDEADALISPQHPGASIH